MNEVTLHFVGSQQAVRTAYEANLKMFEGFIVNERFPMLEGRRNPRWQAYITVSLVPVSEGVR